MPGYSLRRFKYCGKNPKLKWIKGGKPEQCAAECDKNANCKGFTWIFAAGGGCELNNPYYYYFMNIHELYCVFIGRE